MSRVLMLSRLQGFFFNLDCKTAVKTAYPIRSLRCLLSTMNINILVYRLSLSKALHRVAYPYAIHYMVTVSGGGGNK